CGVIAAGGARATRRPSAASCSKAPTTVRCGPAKRAVVMLRYGPALAALLYPLALSALHQSGQQFLHAPDTAGRPGAGLAVGVAGAAACAGAAPWLAGAP